MATITALDRPFTVRRRVQWGECDPAGIVYTPRFADYAVHALHEFVATLIGTPFLRKLADMGIGLPMKAMTFEFRKSLRPEEEFDMRVHVANIGTRTFSLVIEGISLAEQSLFVATMTPICVEPKTLRSMPIPAQLRALLEDYARRFAVPDRQGIK